MELSTLSISGSPFILSLSFLFLVFNGAGVRAIPQDDFVEVKLKFTRSDYFGSIVDEYFQEICFEIDADPTEYVDGWDGYFSSTNLSAVPVNILITHTDILNSKEPQKERFSIYMNESNYCFSPIFPKNYFRQIGNWDLLGHTDISLSVPDGTDVTTRISVYNNDQVMINFKERSQEVSEDEEVVEICAVLSTSLSLDCMVNYILTVSLIIPNTDFEVEGDVVALNFSTCATEACIDIPMVNDDTAEYVVEFKISLELSSEMDQWIQLGSVTTDITITDDDDMLVGFSSSAYTTTETVGQVSVCVGVTNSFNGKALRPLTVAILPDEKFETSNAADDCYKIFEFSTGSTGHCHNYSINNDEVCELGAQFGVRLSLLTVNDTKLRLDPDTQEAVIFIDESREPECFVKVEFVNESVTISEDQPVTVCVSSTSPGIEETFTINITTDNTGLLQNQDPLDFSVNSSSTTSIVCYHQSISQGLIYQDTICRYFTDCNNLPLAAHLKKFDDNDRVNTDDSSSLTIDVEVPQRCQYSTPSPLGVILGTTLPVSLLVLVVFAVIVVVAVFLYRRSGRKGKDSFHVSFPNS